MCEITSDMLLHPDLLPTEILIRILHERQIKIDKLEEMPRYMVLDLFQQYCVPHAQRIYRDSGRGRILNRSRESTSNSTAELPQKQTCTSKILSQRLSPMHTEISSQRIKPPLDYPSQVKRICLSQSPPKPYNVTHAKFIPNNGKRKISLVGGKSPNDTSPPEKKSRTPISWP